MLDRICPIAGALSAVGARAPPISKDLEMLQFPGEFVAPLELVKFIAPCEPVKFIAPLERTKFEPL